MFVPAAKKTSPFDLGFQSGSLGNELKAAKGERHLEKVR